MGILALKEDVYFIITIDPTSQRMVTFIVNYQTSKRKTRISYIFQITNYMKLLRSFKITEVIIFQGPGLFFIVPCIDHYKSVDLRTVSFDVPPQEVKIKQEQEPKPKQKELSVYQKL